MVFTAQPLQSLRSTCGFTEFESSLVWLKPDGTMDTASSPIPTNCRNSTGDVNAVTAAKSAITVKCQTPALTMARDLTADTTVTT